MKIQLMCSQIATVDFNRMDITKEQFDKLPWGEASRLLEIFADIENTEVNDWIFLNEKKEEDGSK